MKVHWQRHCVAQGREQQPCGGWSHQTGHVLYAEYVRAGGFEFPCQLEVVVKVVFWTLGIKHVSGVADRRFTQFAGLNHRVHRHTHVVDPVEAIKDPKEIHAACSRFVNEVGNHVIGVVGIAHTIGTADKRL